MRRDLTTRSVNLDRPMRERLERLDGSQRADLCLKWISCGVET